jgi:hypothetical protein
MQEIARLDHVIDIRVATTKFGIGEVMAKKRHKLEITLEKSRSKRDLDISV